jgi:hypothetical protein
VARMQDAGCRITSHKLLGASQRASEQSGRLRTRPGRRGGRKKRLRGAADRTGSQIGKTAIGRITPYRSIFKKLSLECPTQFITDNN